MHQLRERQRVGGCPTATAHGLQTHTAREELGDKNKVTKKRRHTGVTAYLLSRTNYQVSMSFSKRARSEVTIC